MIQARTTEGVKPATAANRRRSGNPKRRSKRRFLPVSKYRAANKIHELAITTVFLEIHKDEVEELERIILELRNELKGR